MDAESKKATTSRSETPADEAFSIDKALDSKGFALYLDRHPEFANIDVQGTKSQEIERIYKSFQELEAVRPEVIKTLSSEIFKDTTIKLETEEQERLSLALEQMSIDNPEAITRWAERIQTKKNVQELNQELKAAQREAKELQPYTEEGQKALNEANEAQADKLDRALRSVTERPFNFPIIGNLAMPAEVRKARQEAEMMFGKDWRQKVDDLQEKINELRRTVSESRHKATRADELKTELADKSRKYWDLRRDIDQLMDLSGDFRDIYIVKVQEKIDHMFDGASTIKELEAVTQTLQTFDKGPDVATLQTLSYSDIERVKNNLNKKFELLALTSLQDRVQAYEIPGTSAVSKLESQLKEILAAKAVGGRSEAETREFICDTLATIAENKETPPIKKLLLSALLMRLKK